MIAETITAAGTAPMLGMAQILKGSVAAGVAADRVIGHWLEVCLNEKDSAGAREALEVCAPGLGLDALAQNWTWQQVLSRSAKLRDALSLSHFYKLEETLTADGSGAEADAVLREAIGQFPQYSGPVLKLAQRYYENKDRSEGDQVLAAFLRKNPGDQHAAGLLARQAAIYGATRDTAPLLKAAMLAGVSDDLVFGPWLEASLRTRDLAGARNVLEACAKSLGLGALAAGWTWPQVMAKSDRLSSLHLGTYYLLDDTLESAGKAADAVGVLQSAIGAYPKYAGPVMRLAQRFYDKSDWAEGDKLLADFLARVPNDVAATLMLARRAAAGGGAKDMVRLLKSAVDAGAPAESLIGPWLESCFTAKDAPGARRAIEACAGSLGLEPLPWGWTWPQVVARSPALAKGIHVSLYYVLDDQFIAANDMAGADALLRTAMKTYPQYSGPLTRLAERLYARGESAEADRLLIDYLTRVPGDLHAATLYARQAARRSAKN